MTANELADWIENGSPFGDYETAKQASAMLRQQQNEIEALKLRELTDKEIIEVWDEYYEDIDIITFARAILHKASEK
jgi:DNA/RNA-binding domain of Phe-tRNA-synthetase-like protein